MNRTNILVILSTILLGVLLVLVLGIVDEFANPRPVPPAVPADSPPEPQIIQPPPGMEDSFTPAELPVIGDLTSLINVLENLGLNPSAAVARFRDWRQAHGFLGANPLLDINPGAAPENYYEQFDDATLLSMAGSGELGALQLLASRSLLQDPSEAADWYRQAAFHGSVYAMLQMGSLMEFMGNPALDDFNSTDEYLNQVQAVRDEVGNTQEEALAWTLAAVISGGEPVLDTSTARLIRGLEQSMPPGGAELACRRASRILLELAAERRQRGIPTFNTARPPFFTSSVSLQETIPCEDPPQPMVETTDCARHPYQDENGQIMTLNICAN